MNNIVIKINILRKLFVCKILAFFPSLVSIADKIGIMVVLIDPIKIADINVVAVCDKKASLSIPAPNSDAIRI